MNAAYFAVLKAITAATGLSLDTCTKEESSRLKIEGRTDFLTHYVASDERIDVYCYNSDFYPKLITAVASAVMELQAYEIKVPNVNFQMVA